MAVTITAKGDLIAGTGNATYDNLAAGSDGDSLVADSAATTGLRWQSNTSAGKNVIINGAMDVWQRGSSITVGNSGFGADRWRYETNAAPTTATITKETFTPADIVATGYGDAKFYQRVTITTVGSTTVMTFGQKIEDVQTLAGQTVTISFWAKADSARTLTTGVLRQNFGSGGSANVDTSLSNVSLTTAWQRFSQTVTLPSISGKTIGAGSYLWFRYNLPVASGMVVDIWGVQLEAGNVATAFQTATGTIQGELAACQRYYYRVIGGAAYHPYGIGFATSTTAASILINHPVQMRTSPSAIDYSTIYAEQYSGESSTAGTLTLVNASALVSRLNLASVSGFTAGRGVWIYSNNDANGYLGFSAEL
jgi:predicted secreted protein